MLSPKDGARHGPLVDVDGVFNLGTATGGAFIVLPIIDAIFMDIARFLAVISVLAL